MLSWLLAFVGMTVLDITFAAWAKAVSSARPIKASVIAAVLYAVAAYVTVSIVGDNWLIIPACAGAFVGTYIGTRWT